MRWIWIDRLVEFTSGKFARSVRNTSLAEDLYADHFPGYPVMPAALMLEGLAQTGGILVGEANAFQEKVVLAKIPRAHFTREVLAGEQIIYEVELLHLRPEGASVLGKVFAGEPELGRPPSQVGEAEIFFAHLDKSRSQQIFGDKNFVFTGELSHLLNRFLPNHGRKRDGREPPPANS